MTSDFKKQDVAGRKRSHGDFLTQDACVATAFLKSEPIDVDLTLSDKENDGPFASTGASSPPAKFSSASPTPTLLPTSTTQTPSSLTVTKTATKPAAGEPPKKKRLTSEEKAAQTRAAEEKKQKRADERDKKLREKAEAEKEKAAKKAEKDQEKKKRTEEIERRKREKAGEEAKKTRSQMKLTSMFTKGQPTEKPKARDEAKPSGATGDGTAKEASLYDQMFRPFFVKEHVRLAPNPSELDEETREAKSRILDEYLRGERQEPALKFDPVEALQIPGKVHRGRVYPSVKEIMTEFHSLSFRDAADATTESQNAKIRNVMEALKSVPVKSIKFKEHVRPPYIGTISGPLSGGQSLRKLARKPTSRLLPVLNYDYDSEAEWQEDEGEDVDDLDDDDDEGDMDEEMDDFLDDSEDVGPSKMVLEGGMEPDSSGLCWENYKRSNTQPKLYKYRLEFIHEPLEHHHSIDPFSTGYWAPPKSKAGAGDSKPASVSPSDKATLVPASKSTKDAKSVTLISPGLSDAFHALNSGPTGPKRSQQPLSEALQEAMKELVRTKPALTKLGVIEVYASEHPECARAQIKTAFEALFVKSGKVFKVRGE